MERLFDQNLKQKGNENAEYDPASKKCTGIDTPPSLPLRTPTFGGNLPHTHQYKV